MHRKNIRKLGGRPLIGFTVDAVLKARKAIPELKPIVSTDDEEIMKICQSMGIEVPFLRPVDLASDLSPSIDFVMHALDHYLLLGAQFESVMVLQPTSPMRTEEDIIKAFRLFKKEKAESLISVFADETLSETIMYRERDGRVIPLSSNHGAGLRRQDEPPILVRNGAIYISTVDFIRRSKRLLSDGPSIYKMPKNRSFNIDTLADFELVSRLLDFPAVSSLGEN